MSSPPELSSLGPWSMRPSAFHRFLRLLPLLGLPLLSRAEPGMWMPEQISDLGPVLKELGFQGDAAALGRLDGPLLGPLVSLSGSTGSFVSHDGLIATNDHCVQTQLQYNSTPERNLLRDGYLAESRDKELWGGPNTRCLITIACEDVTAEVTRDLRRGMSDEERRSYLDRRLSELARAREKDPAVHCSILPFYQGLRYYAISQLEIQDLRLVYAPPSGIGNFGGETDNWQWPRHTGDFAFLRAYVAPNGRPAAYSVNNVPYQPASWFRLSTRGAAPGQLVLVPGYPGQTARHLPLARLRTQLNWTIPRTIERYGALVAQLSDLSRSSPETALHVATRLRSLRNSLTKARGVLEGAQRNQILDTRESEETRLADWIQADRRRRDRYGHILGALRDLEIDSALTREHDSLLLELLGNPTCALHSASVLLLVSSETARPSSERGPSFQDRNLSRYYNLLESQQQTLDREVDRSVLRYTLHAVAELPAESRLTQVDHYLGLKPGLSRDQAWALVDAWVDNAVSSSRLYEQSTRLELYMKSTRQLLATKDPLIQLAYRLTPALEEQQRRQIARDTAFERLVALHEEAFRAMDPDGLRAPDANGTLRLSFGTVRGVEDPDGSVYQAQSTLRGLLEKHTNTGDFQAPARELAAIASTYRPGSGLAASPLLEPTLGDIPVNFLSTVDTTSGNSGSPTLNARGELVGLLFDGTLSSVASDYLYDRQLTRAIHVDVRYLLWVLTEVEHADALLQELDPIRN